MTAVHKDLLAQISADNFAQDLIVNCVLSRHIRASSNSQWRARLNQTGPQQCDLREGII